MRNVLHFSVGAPEPPATTLPVGFAPIFPGWNVWDVYQSDDPIEGLIDGVLSAGTSLERQLKIWVEDSIKDGAPGAEVARPMNVGMLRGDNVQIITNPAGLTALVTRAAIPELGGALQLGEEGSKAVRRTVRFFNRAAAAMLAWPHDANYLLDVVYQPSSSNPITNAPPPAAFGDEVEEVGRVVGKAAKMVLVGGAIVLGALLLINLRKG